MIKNTSRRNCLLAGFACLNLAAAPLALADIRVQDDAGRTVRLEQPAQRIVSLAPHVTELLFAAGAGNKLAAVTDYSDYPEAAKKIPSIGNIFALDLERLLAIKPDLIVIWGTGNARVLAEKLRGHHLVVYESEPRNYEMIASSIEKLGKLAGSEKEAQQFSSDFRQRLQKLRQTYQLAPDTPAVGVFYQMIQRPLMTPNDQHMISAAIRLCGGKNVFGHLKDFSATISQEAVLAANPDMLLTSGENTESLASWKQFSMLNAVRKQQMYAIKGDWLNRSGPRILDATEALCQHISTVRKKMQEK